MDKYKKELFRIFREYGHIVLVWVGKYNKRPDACNTVILDHLSQRYYNIYGMIEKCRKQTSKP